MSFRRERLSRSHRPGPVTGEKGYQRYRECLRLEFSYQCIYCGSHESEVAPGDAFGGFEIDHFRPIAKFRDRGNDYLNLVWACRACNRTKAGRWPTPKQFARNDRFIDADQEAVSDHLALEGDQVVPVRNSRPGAFTILHLRLNSAVHRHRRRERSNKLKQDKLEQSAAVLTQFVEQLRAELDIRDASDLQREELLRLLLEAERELQPYQTLGNPPWDAVNQCYCTAGATPSDEPSVQTPPTD